MNGDRYVQHQRARRTLPPRQARPEPPPVIRREGPPAAAYPRTPPLRRVSPRPPQVPGRRPLPGPPATPHLKRRKRRRVGLSLLLGSLLGGAGILAAMSFDATLHRQPALTDYPQRPGPGRGTNWLLVGSDSRQGLTAEQQHDLATGGDIGSSRTDTILLVHVPAQGSSTPTTVVSIPRDSYVPIPGHGKDKINAGFAIGGAPLLTRTVQQATGLRLDHYAEIGFGGFAAMVDAVGGVNLCLPAPVNDPLAGIDLASGCQQLDGRHALGYVRTRATPRADLDRMIVQRQFLSALLHRASSPPVWLDPARWYAVPHAAADALTVDRGDHVWDLARLGQALHGSTVAITVPIGRLTSGGAAGAVVVWDHSAAATLFDALASDAPVPAGVLGAQM